jgi:hypothetical protein
MGIDEDIAAIKGKFDSIEEMRGDVKSINKTVGDLKTQGAVMNTKLTAHMDRQDIHHVAPCGALQEHKAANPSVVAADRNDTRWSALFGMVKLIMMVIGIVGLIVTIIFGILTLVN